MGGSAFDGMASDGAIDGDPDSEVRVTALSLSGRRLELPPFRADRPLAELKKVLREHWAIPMAAQRLAVGTRAVRAGDGERLGFALGVPHGGEVEVSCVRMPLPPTDQRVVDERLLEAAARGDHAEMTEAIAEGAQIAPEAREDADAGPRGSRRLAPTPLTLALAASDERAADLLRHAGAPEEDMEPRSASLRAAFAVGDFSDVARWLAQGASPNLVLRAGEGIIDTNFGTPLHACCAQHRYPGAVALAGLLLRMRADVNASDSEGDSPLAHARYFGARGIYELLAVHGARVQGPYYHPIWRLGRR